MDFVATEMPSLLQDTKTGPDVIIYLSKTGIEHNGRVKYTQNIPRKGAE
jgi:hypothetical protein